MRTAPDTDNAAIGAVLRMARLDSHLSQEGVAQTLRGMGIKTIANASTIETIENGERPLSLAESKAYAKAVNIDLRGIINPHRTLEERARKIASKQALKADRNAVRAILDRRAAALQSIDSFLAQNPPIGEELTGEIRETRREWEDLSGNAISGYVTAHQMNLFKKGWEAADKAGLIGRRVESGFKAIGFTVEGQND